MILNLGVIDQFYNTPGNKGAVSTGDVAGWLENKYHVMESFYELHSADIAKDLEKSVKDALINLIASGRPTKNPFASAEANIEKAFRMFLSQQELDALGYPGIPTKVAKEGRTLRRKYKRGPPRPSFIDTGLYQTSFKAWIEGTLP